MNARVSTRNTLIFILIICLFSLGLAYYSQYVLDIKPCILCLYQRYVLMGIGTLAIFGISLNQYGLCAIFAGAFGYLANAGIGTYQVMIEKGILAAPSMCKKAVLGSKGLSLEQLTEQIMNNPIVSCDEVAWSLFGISFAGYSVMYSLLMGLACLVLGVLIYGQERIA